MSNVKQIAFSLLFLFSLTSLFSANIKNKPFVLVIDPGHGGKDPGAVGAISKEKNINLTVALLIGNQISQNHPDVKVVYTRKKDIFIPLGDRSALANKEKADLFISIHTNASKSKQPYGTETFALGPSQSEESLEVVRQENSVILLEENYETKYQGYDQNSVESAILFEIIRDKYMEQSISFASTVQSELKNSCRRYDRGVKQGNLYVLRKTAMPSVLIELGFISNKSEERYMNTEDGQQNLSQSIVEAFAHYKRDYDRKAGHLPSARETKPAPTVVEVAPETKIPEEKAFEPKNDETKITDSKTSGIVYKIQILTSGSKLSAKSSQLKKYKADYYYEKGLYKYTYGESSDWEEISRIRRSLLKDFKDAFIITFKDGIKIPNK